MRLSDRRMTRAQPSTSECTCRAEWRVGQEQGGCWGGCSQLTVPPHSEATTAVQPAAWRRPLAVWCRFKAGSRNQALQDRGYNLAVGSAP